jgi:hypothetical protein
MADRKTARQQEVAQSIYQANPSDRVITTMHAIAGPSPWLMAVLAQGGLIGALIGQLFMDYYYVTLTDQAVVFHRASSITGRPKELQTAIPRLPAAHSLSDFRRNTVWSCFWFQFPDRQKPTRINVHRKYRAELDQFVWSLTGIPVPTG